MAEDKQEVGLTTKPLDERLLQERTASNPRLRENISPEYLEIGPDATHRIHSEYILERTNLIRRQCHGGEFDKIKSMRDVFHTTHKLHMGTEPLQHIIAIFDPGEKWRRELETMSGGEMSFAATIRSVENRLKATAEEFTHGKLRTSEMSMARVGGEILMGVPTRILPALERRLFDKVDRIIADYAGNPAMDDREAFDVSVAAATVLDLLHFKSDCNGRASEDWMVELQRRLYSGQLNKIKTWSLDGLRAKGINDILLDNVPDPYDSAQTIDPKQRHEERDRLLYERKIQTTKVGKAVLTRFLDRAASEDPASVAAINRLKDQLSSKTGDRDQIREALDEEMDALLQRRAELLEQVMGEIIDGLTNPAVRAEFGLTGVADCLWAAREGTDYLDKWRTFRFEDTHMQPQLAQEALTRVREQLEFESKMKDIINQEMIEPDDFQAYAEYVEQRLNEFCQGKTTFKQNDRSHYQFYIHLSFLLDAARTGCAKRNDCMRYDELNKKMIYISDLSTGDAQQLTHKAVAYYQNSLHPAVPEGAVKVNSLQFDLLEAVSRSPGLFQEFLTSRKVTQ